MNWLIRAFPFDPEVGVERTVYVSLRGWVSEPDEPDAAPNTYWDRRVEVPLTETVTLFDGDDVGGRSTASIGALSIANDDGGLDHWLDWCWDGRAVELYRSEVDRPRYLADFELVTRRTIEELVPGDTIELALTDAQSRFDAPARRGTFAGTGGAEGNAALKGRAKPFLLGLRRRFEPVLIDAALNKYMIDPAGIDDLLDADDGGDPFVLGPDVADDSALSAQDMTGLDIVSCLAEGTLRLSEPPLYRLRVSAKGVAPGGIWIYCTADLAQHAATAFAGLTGGEIDGDSIDALNALQPGVVGYWHDGSGELSAASLIDALMDGIGGFWGIGLDGRMHVGRYDLPAETASITINRRDMLSLVPQQAARRIKSVRLSYRPGLALTESELAEGIAAEARELAMQDREWTAPATDAATQTQSLLAGELERDTLFDDEADAEAERDRLLALLSARRQPFDVVVALGAGFDGVKVGDTVRLIDTRYGLAAGRDVVVLRRVADTAPNIPELTFTVL